MTVFQGKLSPVSNREDWNLTLEIDDENDDPIDLTGASITVNIRDPRYRAVVLCGSTSNGAVTILGTGVFQVSFSAAQLQPFRPGTYEVGMVLVQNGVTIQLLIGLLPVIDGIMSP
jgi:hypothetical protein